jgi:hypothetical protein
MMFSPSPRFSRSPLVLAALSQQQYLADAARRKRRVSLSGVRPTI